MSKNVLKVLFIPSPNLRSKLERSYRINNMVHALRTLNIKLLECCSFSSIQDRIFIYKRLICLIDCLKNLQSTNPDVILASDTMAGFVGAILKLLTALRRSKTVFIYDSHGVPIRGFHPHMIIEDFLSSIIADCIITVTPYDRNFYYITFRKKVFVIPSFVNPQSISFKPFSERSIDFAFHGNFKYPPNREALNLIVVLARKLPHHHFVIFGPGSKDLKLALPNIRILGYVEDPYDVLCTTKFYLAPLFRGRGIITKVLDAMACGAIPIVTEFVARGIPELRIFEDLIIANSIGSFYSKVLKVIHLNLDLLDKIGKLLQQIVINKYSFNRNKVVLKQVLERCISGEGY